MAEEKPKDATEVDVEITSIVTQIFSDISTPKNQSEPSTSDNYHEEQISSSSTQQTSSNLRQEGEGVNTATASNIVEDAPKKVPPYQTCTVKDILSEILDSTVIRRPSLQLPSTSQGSERNVSSVSEYTVDPRLTPRQIYIRSDSTESTSSRMRCTVREALSEIMDYNVVQKMNRLMNVYDFTAPGTSKSEQFARGGQFKEYEVYRALGPGIVNSSNAIHDEAFIQRSSAVSIKKILPSYSTVLKMGPPPAPLPRMCSSCSFVPRKPPPRYAEVEGIWEDSPSLISSESAVFGPDPTYMICPRCRTAVITEVQVRRSIMTHVVAVCLCLCLCWPCCLMPYCLRSCNYSHHSCPHCSYYFGMYRPF